MLPLANIKHYGTFYIAIRPIESNIAYFQAHSVNHLAYKLHG